MKTNERTYENIYGYLLHHCHENMMNACELLLMRARARRAYCKKCRVHIALERVGRSNIPVLIEHGSIEREALDRGSIDPDPILRQGVSNIGG